MEAQGQGGRDGNKRGAAMPLQVRLQIRLCLPWVSHGRGEAVVLRQRGQGGSVGAPLRMRVLPERSVRVWDELRGSIGDAEDGSGDQKQGCSAEAGKRGPVGPTQAQGSEAQAGQTAEGEQEEREGRMLRNGARAGHEAWAQAVGGHVHIRR